MKPVIDEQRLGKGITSKKKGGAGRYRATLDGGQKESLRIWQVYDPR